MNQAERWIGLSDGGNGLEPSLLSHFPLIETVIIDFWHVSDHLGDLARTLHPNDEEAAKSVKGEWCHVLKHRGGQAVIDLLQTMPLPDAGQPYVKNLRKFWPICTRTSTAWTIRRT